MDLSTLSNEELAETIRSLSRRPSQSTTGKDLHVTELSQQLQAHKFLLEVQSRTLRETQSAMADAVQRYAELYDHLPIGYVTVTSTGRIVHANLTAAGWLRRDRAQLAGASLHWFLDAFDAGRFIGHLESCEKNHREEHLDVTLRLENGLLLTVHLSTRTGPVGENGERHFHTAISNVSNLRQAHAVMDDITSEQEAFSRSLSDDLRSPLVTISRFARTLLQQHAASLNAEVKQMVERMESAAVRMESMLHNLLDYCCPARDDFAMDPVNLDELMQHVLVEYRGVIKQHAARVSVERPLPCVRGSRLMLTQVLANIFTYALRHGAPSHAPFMRVSAVTEDRAVILKIADDNALADPDSDAPQFRVFERLHASPDGLGPQLRLAIVRRAVERMHGRVWVESHVSSGNCFNIELVKV